MIGLAMALALAASPAKALRSPQCASWPTNMALVHLKNAGLIDPAQVDGARTKTVRLATEKVGKDLFRQVYDITFYASPAKTVEVITRSDASSQECSLGAVDVYVVSAKLGGS